MSAATMDSCTYQPHGVGTYQGGNKMTTATITHTATNVTAIDFNDIAKTYRGKTGCACGCGGDYLYIEHAENAENIAKHFKAINSAIKNEKATLEFFGCGVEVSSPSYTTVTRIYFVDGIDYTQYASGRIERRVTVKEGN
jgi:hypothetical protein